MVTDENVGFLVKYWKTTGKGTGWHIGTLKKVDGITATIHHTVLKRDQKVLTTDCDPYDDGGRTMSGSIFDHLYRVAQTAGVGKQEPGQSDQDYLKRILRAVHGVNEQLWNSIPVPAQQWFNEAATLVSQAKPIPPCPGFMGKDEIQKTIDTVVPPKGLTAEEALNQPVAPQTDPQKRVHVASSPQVRPKLADVTKPKRQVTGVMDALRRTVVVHPEWTSRQLYDYLKLNGFPNAKLDTISVDGGNIKRVIEIAKELGFWNEKGNVSGTDIQSEHDKEATGEVKEEHGEIQEQTHQAQSA